jgi:hypothetical protein
MYDKNKHHCMRDILIALRSPAEVVATWFCAHRRICGMAHRPIYSYVSSPLLVTMYANLASLTR